MNYGLQATPVLTPIANRVMPLQGARTIEAKKNIHFSRRLKAIRGYVNTYYITFDGE